MNGWWVTDVINSAGVPYLISWVFWIIFSIVLHELAHGWAAIRCGDRTPIELGHMTWNPVVHMGIPSLVVFAIVGITWGAMPVNPARFRGRHDDAFVAIAGPAMNAILVVAAAIGYILWVGCGSGKWFGNAPMANDDLFFNMMVFFRVGVMLNIVLALFNLVPVPPLDGSRVLGSFVPAYRRAFQGQAGTVIGIILFIVVFNSAGKILFGAATTATMEILGFLESALIPGLHTPIP